MSTRCLLGLSVLLAAPRITDASSCVPGFDYGAFGKTSLDWGGNSGVDSWNSSVGTYATTHSNTGGNLGTDGTSSGALTVHGTSSTVFGDLYIGAGASTSNITINGNPTTGTQNALGTALSLPAVTLPTGFTSGGACSGCTMVSGTHYTSTSGTVTIGSGTFYVDSLGGTLNITGAAVIYVGTSFAPTAINNTLSVPGDAVFMCGSSVTSIALTGLDGYYAIYAPSADIDIHGGTTIYGAVVGNNIAVSGNPNFHYDKALSSFAGGGFSCSTIEISRASPVLASITDDSGTVYSSAIVQGTFENPVGIPTTLTTAASIATWTFPYIKGHMRARDATTIDGTSYSNGTVIFDAGATGKIPAASASGCAAPYVGSCRAIFTNTNSAATNGLTFGSALNVKTLDYSNATTSTTIGGLIATGIAGVTTAQYQALIQTIENAKLGGVDRSTVAVIQNSGIAGNGSRPKIAYFGATDGMLHAVCAQKGGTNGVTANICPSVGTELWAFLPRVQLPLLKTNVGRIDGSVRVTDMFGDFSSGTGNGTKSWKTIVTFQTGFAIGGTPAIYALDVTDPANPSVVWEVTPPSSPATVDMGTGLTLAVGPTIVTGVLTNLVVAETNNGGTAYTTTSGMVATALRADTGAQAWQTKYSYPSPPRSNATDGLTMPYNGIPGGAVGVDLKGNGYFSNFVMGDLYGNLWNLKADTGVSANGAGTPLFSFSTNKHPIGAPPAIYSNGSQQYAAVASGGYADPTATGWSTTSPAQRIIAAKLSYTGATVDETTAAAVNGTLEVNQALTGAAAADRAYSQALVVGNQLFVTSDATDVNSSTYGAFGTNTGHMTTVNLGTPTTAGTVVAFTGVQGGGGSVVNNGTSIFNGKSVATATAATGNKVDLSTPVTLTRNVWLRTM